MARTERDTAGKSRREAKTGKIPQQSDRGVLTEIAEKHIRTAIESKILKPGEILDFNALADTMNMSRTPIRESIRQLHNAGLLEPIAGGQFRVPVLTKDRIRAYYAVRIELELKASEVAALRITDPEIELLVHNLELFLARAEDETLLPRIDTQFHEIIYEASRNRYLAKRLRSLRVFLGLIPRKSFQDKNRIQEIHAEHSAIAGALAKRDPEKVKQAALTHIRKAMEAPLS